MTPAPSVDRDAGAPVETAAYPPSRGVYFAPAAN
jgi:hypothetical protein